MKMTVEKMSKGKERKWKENEETRWKLHDNLGLGYCFERPLRPLAFFYTFKML